MTLLAMFMWQACQINKQAAPTNSRSGNNNTNATATINSNDPTLTLFDLLRRVAGVQVSGTKDDPVITVRNSYTISSSDNGPLYVIDGRSIGKDYHTAASLVEVNDIKSISVLKDVASTSSYGLLGAGGVIVINTKKGR